MLNELLKKKEALAKRISEIESELNEEKDNEDTWGGHEGPGYMDTEAELLLRVELLKDIEKRISALRVSEKK